MSFLEKYRIDSLLGEGETMSFRALDTSTGQPVLLHQLLPGRTAPHQPELAPMVFKYLPGAGAPGTEYFVEIGQDEGRVFIVTMDVPECLDLRKWLQSIADSQPYRGNVAGPFQGEPSSPQAGWPPSADAGSEFRRKPAVRPVERRTRGQVPSGFEVVYQSRKEPPPAAAPPAPLSQRMCLLRKPQRGLQAPMNWLKY